jgi:hypothetical protein
MASKHSDSLNKYPFVNGRFVLPNGITVDGSHGITLNDLRFSTEVRPEKVQEMSLRDTRVMERLLGAEEHLKREQEICDDYVALVGAIKSNGGSAEKVQSTMVLLKKFRADFGKKIEVLEKALETSTSDASPV